MTSFRTYKFTKPIINGEPTKATKILLDVYTYSKLGYYFRKEELLRRAGVKDYSSRGMFSGLWDSAKYHDLCYRKNGFVYPGEALVDYLVTYHLI